MLRVNGLFGWIRANDQRSILLFAGFVIAFQIAAAIGLTVPLMAFDFHHAPWLNWGGYAVRYLPLVTLGAVLLFAAQMAWHVATVRRMVAFAFVDNADEPRLCRIVERVAMTMGLPAPYVGVIAQPALNAFACGIRRADAVVVVTRGLIDGLDDEELEAVIAHELAHIANGDIRLMAAANVCLNTITWSMRRRREKKVHPVWEVIGLPLAMLLFPPLFLFVLTIGFLAQLALRSTYLVRLLIASSREFVADAQAVEATQNPAALVSALRRIEGRSQVDGMPGDQDAMLIDGNTEGSLATHPTIAERIEAIVSVTGSMALIAPSRRDSRPQPGGFGRRAPAPAPVLEAAPPIAPRRSRLARAWADDQRNWLGLTPRSSFGALLAVAVFIGFHASDDPRRTLASLDPRVLNRLAAQMECHGGKLPPQQGSPCAEPAFTPVAEQMTR